MRRRPVHTCWSFLLWWSSQRELSSMWLPLPSPSLTALATVSQGHRLSVRIAPKKKHQIYGEPWEMRKIMGSFRYSQTLVSSTIFYPYPYIWWEFSLNAHFMILSVLWENMIILIVFWFRYLKHVPNYELFRGSHQYNIDAEILFIARTHTRNLQLQRSQPIFLLIFANQRFQKKYISMLYSSHYY